MQNVILAFPNRADECTLTGGSWSAGLPLDNLKNRIIRKPARSTDDALASTWFDAAMTKERPVKVVSLVNHNLSTAALYRLRLSNAADFSSPSFDSGWLAVWPVVFPFGSLQWGVENWWSGMLAEEDRAGYTSALIVTLPIAVTATYLRLEINDSGNADGYVQAGRLFVAGQWQPRYNHSYGIKLGFEDKSTIEESVGGTEYFDQRTRYRVTRLSLDWLSEDEAHANALEMQRSLGISGEVLLIPNPDDSIHLFRRAYLGRMRTLSPIEHPYHSTYKNAFEIKEIV